MLIIGSHLEQHLCISGAAPRHGMLEWAQWAHLDAEAGSVCSAQAVGVLNHLEGDAAVLEGRQVPLHALQ